MNARVQFVETVIPVTVPTVSRELQDLQQKIPAYLAGSVAGSTSGIYHNSFQRFKNFCISNGVPFLPSDPNIIMAYLIKVSENMNSAAPALAARSAIRHYNLLHKPNLSSPTDASDVAMLIKSIERKFSAPVKKREGTSPQIVRKFVDLLLLDQLKQCAFQRPLEDWFLVAKTIVKFHCFARFEEVIALKWDNFTILPTGDIEITFLKAKNNQFHDAKKSVIAKNVDEPHYCPVNIIWKYFHVLGRPALSAFFLPKIVKKVAVLDQAASYYFCNKQFKTGLTRIGVDPTGFGEHSDRSGGLSAAASVGCTPSDLQTQGRWKSDYAPKLYLKKSKEKRSHVSKVLNSLKSVNY